MLPSILANQLKQGMGDYLETTFPMTNEPFKGSVKKMFETKDSVYHEPYISVRLPFRVLETIPNYFESIHPEYAPYVHQSKAFERLTGDDGRSSLIATGTGSGKTECFLYPILEYCYKHRGEPGVKALIIYPMNALASDQAKRIAELIYNSPELKGNVTAGMYVGGEDKNASRMMTEHGVITDHETMLNYAPDILMTNYKMLDYLLVRPKDAALWRDNTPETLKYIAVDEFHTFDGAQGTDLACLLRRLKSKLRTLGGYLCCIGTSATMGSKDNEQKIIEYASEVFGEPFERHSVITEDRLSADEFLFGYDITEFSVPNKLQVERMIQLVDEDDEATYLEYVTDCWMPEFEENVLTDKGRIQLGNALMHHSFVQTLLRLIEGKYYQAEDIVAELSVEFPFLKETKNSAVIIDSILALISHARIGSEGHLRPFLNVQVQLWFKELRRLLAKVDGDNITYEIAHDLNAQQAKQYLPVVNCRDCGATGWVTILNERQNATMTNLEGFYNRYFQTDDQIAMLFPHGYATDMKGLIPATICPDCLHVELNPEGNITQCSSCGTDVISVLIPDPIPRTPGRNKQYVCPFCNSNRGLSLMGIRSATEISASISQLFASKFNDDKKTLAFSDNVQDAAHRAGFFNARTWRFGLRTAMQKYVSDGGAGLNLQEFQKGFIDYWRSNMSDEEFVGFFIAPNMTWMSAYQDMVSSRKFGDDHRANILMSDIQKRIKYEIMLEYGVAGRIGRTLQKSGCSILYFDAKEIQNIAERVQEKTINELGVLTDLHTKDFEKMVARFLLTLKNNGAFDDSVFDDFLAEEGKLYKLSNDWNRWLPGMQSGRNTPRFIVDSFSKKRLYHFDKVTDRKYTDCIFKCCGFRMIEESNYDRISEYILEELVKEDIVKKVASPADFNVYGLNKEKVFVSRNVVQLVCDSCGSKYVVAEENKKLMEGVQCLQRNCSGDLELVENAQLDYYGKLYSTGDMIRINSQEHTGLLERPDREQLEIDFKRDKSEQNMWDPNVLSCTPTLEMGIDIGDLSTVILCSMPPAQAQFMQRAGRAGRKDGNALTLAVANARPHDLYFYADPLDMISGEVRPPKIFLRASAVLERQFVAYCMDSWVSEGVEDGAVPKRMSVILTKLDARPTDMFPFNFLSYVQSKLSTLLNSFIYLFSGYMDEAARNELSAFARGSDVGQSIPMHVGILQSFEDLKKHRDSIMKSISQLNDMVKELELKPQDSSYEEEIKELKREEAALMNVVREINKKNIFQFLSDEGILPNYAFPEAGIVLKAILYRKDDSAVSGSAKKKYSKMVHEYSRSASSAISEFAPNNSFYVDGRKLTVDQVDLTTSQTAKWRLCPCCSHAQLEETGKNVASCPKCGSPGWADNGQVRNMLKVQMVYSNMDDTKSRISDDSDDRSNVFYCKQLLVDVEDESSSNLDAYQMDNKDFPFGYEFVHKATLREINFGENDTHGGEKFSVSGVEEVRKGFKICKYCGKIQTEGSKKTEHTFSCKTRKMSSMLVGNSYEECLFLYREFDTEILRLLIPATTENIKKTESFAAAFMLGMREYFGNVDHLRVTVCDVPVPDGDQRKQYLVIYDSVPGGTGYLKQMMNEEHSLVEIFEKALSVLENCTCNDDPDKDGCYHCLYAYRQSRSMGNVSRDSAKSLLRSILSGKDKLHKIAKIGDIAVNSLFDSELEADFIEAVKQKVGSGNCIDFITTTGKHGYRVVIEGQKWEIEPQVELGPHEGVPVYCKPDFVFKPLSSDKHKPIAVFTDGFTFHKDCVADDTLKREAIRRSGKYRVWALSYNDVKATFQPQGDYASDVFAIDNMPLGKMYHQIVNSENANRLDLSKSGPFDLLIEYMKKSDAEVLFATHAKAYSMALLDMTVANNQIEFNNWYDKMSKVVAETKAFKCDFSIPGTFYGTWTSRTKKSHLYAYAGIQQALMKGNKNAASSVCIILQDTKEQRTDKYQEEWNGFWHLFNVLQFDDSFVAVTESGIEEGVYQALPVSVAESIQEVAATNEDVAGTNYWDEIICDEYVPVKVIDFAKKAKENNITPPDDLEPEIEFDDTDAIAMAELVWYDQQLAYVLDDQTEDRELLVAHGWIIVNDESLNDKSMFGGDK